MSKLSDITDKKIAFINKISDKLQSDIVKMQSELLDSMLIEVMPLLEVDQFGNIISNQRNIEIIQDIDDVFEKINVQYQTEIVQSIGDNTLKINSLNNAYFTNLFIEEAYIGQFKKILKNTENIMSYKIGISPKNGKLIKDGFLDRFVSDPTVKADLKDMTLKAVTSQQNFESFITSLKETVKGTEATNGIFERYYKQNATDVYSQYNNAYNLQIADDLDMNYFIYQGGIISDSREFCIKHNDKVFTRKEAEKFKRWKDSSGKVPSYISKFPSYDPLIDCGGFNCRHQISWITQEMAFKLRPDLKK